MSWIFNYIEPQKIAEIIIKEVIPILFKRVTNTAFIIGANLHNPGSIRVQLADELSKTYKTRVYFPEHLFSEEMYGVNNDLLSLENLLCESVDFTLLCVESPGAIAELGAFINHEHLRKRLIVINDKNLRKEKSFINQGPIRFLRKLSKDSVIWHDFQEPDMNSLKKSIYKKMSSIGPNRELSRSLANPIIMEQFILSCLYVLKAASIEDFDTIVRSFVKENPDNCMTMCRAVISALTKQRLVTMIEQKRTLTHQGRLRLQGMMFSYQTVKILDNLRIEIMNIQLRKKEKRYTWRRVS